MTPSYKFHSEFFSDNQPLPPSDIILLDNLYFDMEDYDTVVEHIHLYRSWKHVEALRDFKTAEEVERFFQLLRI